MGRAPGVRCFVTTLESSMMIDVRHVLMVAGTGSTTSEASCQAVRMACQELVQRMRPFVTKGATWQDVCAAAMPGYDIKFPLG